MTGTPPSTFRWVFRQLVTLTVTLGVLAAAGASGLAGYGVIATKADVAAGPTAPMTAVPVMQVAFSNSYTVTRRFRRPD